MLGGFSCTNILITLPQLILLAFFFFVGYSSKACFELEEYQTAIAALMTGASLVPGDARFTDLISKCEECIAGTLGMAMCFL